MQIPRHLLKAFTEVTSNSDKDSSKKTSVLGTAVVTDSRKYVRLDSSNLLTPISEATDIQNGDRVLVSIENHKATVIGNYTCPASSRTASNYLRHTDDGLLLGALDENGKQTGTASLIAPGTYYVVDEAGNRLASFASGEINLGDLDAIIRFCGDKCRIYSSDGVMVLYGANATGLRSAFTNTAGTYRAEVVCRSKDDDPIVSIQAYKTDDEDPAHISVSREGVSLTGPSCTCNGSEILRSNKLLATGTITATGSINAGSNATIFSQVTIPKGFHLVGIREVTPSNAHALISRFYTNPSTNTVGVKLKNTASYMLTNLTVAIEWFALYTKGSTYEGEDIITFEEDNTTEEGGE